MSEELLYELNLTGALTDLFGGLMLLPMIAVIACRKTEKREEKRLWLLFFASLAASCLLGFIAHYFCTGMMFRLMWIPLYAVMFESVAAFFLLALYRFREKMPSRGIVIGLHAALLAAYLTIMILDVFFVKDMIRAFVIVAGVVGIAGFWITVRSAVRREGRADRVMLSALIPLLGALYWQIRREGWVRIIWAFNYNGLAHLYIILALCLLFVASLIALKRTERK